MVLNMLVDLLAKVPFSPTRSTELFGQIQTEQSEPVQAVSELDQDRGLITDRPCVMAWPDDKEFARPGLVLGAISCPDT